MKRKLMVLLILILCVVGLLITLFIQKAKEGERILADISFSEVNVESLSNGSYLGEFEAGLVQAKVEVLVEDGRITNIKLLQHQNGRGEPAERLIDEVLAKQTTAVDAISGATYSSLVIRKAIENALT